MKRWFVVICVFCLLMSGCDMRYKSVKSVELPENVTMTAELPDEYPEELKVYKAEWALRDGDLLFDVLMRSESSNVYKDPIYHIYHAENAGDEEIREILYIGRIPKAGQEVLYHYHRNQVDDVWIRYCVTEPEYAENFGYAYKEYKKDGNLNFLRTEVIENRIQEKLDALNIVNLEVKEYELYDMETMQENLAIYNEMEQELGVTEYTFSKADEWCKIQYQQVLDGVPFAVENKYFPRTNYRATTYVGGEAKYSARLGLEGLYLENLVTVGSVVETLEVSSPQEAVQAWCDHYETEDDEAYEIQEVELCYVVRNNAYRDYAYPYWVIRTAVNYEMLESDGWEDYRSFMIDVTTGDIL